VIEPRADFQGTAVTSALLASVRRRRDLRAGLPGAGIHPLLAPKPSDYVVSRLGGVTSFHATELDAILRTYSVSTVILVGVSTNVALAGTTIEATNRGYNVVVPEDCTAGATDSAHGFMIREFFPLLATVTTSKLASAALRAASSGKSQ
jgi:nicotinamidase-related amidase